MSYKKLKITAIIVLISLVTLEIAAVLSNDLYFEKVAAKEVRKRKMPSHTANAVKHAYAASLVYSGFRTVYFSENIAKNATIFFGKINEMAEVVFKPNQDSTLEMMKDLQNNLIGIHAAKWLEENEEQDRLDFIGSLAERKILILFREEIALPDEEKLKAKRSSSYREAEKWFEENRKEIEENIKIAVD